MIGPKHVLPQLHFKTHFKAVQEYALGDAISHRSMRDSNGNLERQIKDGIVKLEREREKAGLVSGRSKSIESPRKDIYPSPRLYF